MVASKGRVLDVFQQAKKRNQKLSPKEIGKIARCQDNTVMARKHDLEKDGYTFSSERINNPDGSHHFLYWLVGLPEQKNFYQHKNICVCRKSYWSINGKCNKCGTNREDA